ncbi:lymphocyte antigen 75-like [Notechis scutatus]|uniref:Lymphocyte antigen 75-like n=1 Tax=Notechis scutatus TaxID=8663 RepID=A0A6J1UII7_9SAUR|nr:lymphocyte antigen 75-like [Notechis scutatus]
MRGLLRGSVSTCGVILTVAILYCCANRAAASDNNLFTIRHENSNKCIQVKSQHLILGNCEETDESLWTWVSQHRLFNLGSQKCLGLETVKSTSTLKMFACDSELNLWWRCVGDSILSTSQNKLALKNGILTASLNSSDAWRRSNSSDTICKFPYSESYTRDGNAYGKPCEFPFLHNNTWYHDCIYKYPGGKWCSITTYFNQDEQWGFCLKREDGCQNTWEQFKDSGNCYQLNTQAALSWKAAYLSCKKQGSDLVSITSASELNYIRAKDGIAEIFWIGLNQLDVSGGWHWSDHNPLNFVSWNSEMQDVSPLEGNDCAAMNADTGDWKSYPCDTPLPYVCKKQVNDSQLDFPDIQNNVETQCESGWYANNGFCYMLKNNIASWNDSYQLCNELNSSLISIHSLADVELVITKLHNDTKDKIWIGLINKEIPAFFKWSDDSKVIFTYWDQNEPRVSFKSLPNCVSYSGKFGLWNILPCNNKLKFVCMKKGKVLEERKSDKACSPSKEWKKHGDYCYRIDKNEVFFGSVCNLTIANRFEQEFINNLITMHNKLEEKYFWTGLQDISSSGEYRWGSVDRNNELLTYTNWGFFQPGFHGGCVAMSNGRYLGKWEVKDCQTFKAYSICKKYIGPKRETEIMPKITDPCPQGWSRGSGLSCYKFFHKERVLRTRTWEEAERFCEALGGHLPSFSNSEEIKELHTILREIISDDRWVWIGLNKRNPDLLDSWQWSDNKPVSSVVMPLEFREDDYDLRDCAAVKTLGRRRRPLYHMYLFEDREEDFYLKPFHCDVQLEWVCQIPKGSTPKRPEWYKPDEEGIHGPTLNIDGSEFWFVANKHLSYQEASLYCYENGSDLAYVTSFTALNGILNTILKLSDENQNWWFKYKIPAIHYRLPSDTEMDGRHYHWTDEKHISFSRWSEEGKDLLGDCVYLDTDGFWKTSECYTEKPGAVCYLPGNDTETQEAYPESIKCPHQVKNMPWIAYQNSCYTFLIPQNRWRGLKAVEANNLCMKMNSNASLLSIRDEDENDFILEQFQSYSGLVQWMWLGLIYDTDGNLLKWYDDTYVSYNNWRNGRPNIKSNFFLAGVNMDGFWDIYDHSHNNWLYWQFGFHSLLVCKLDLETKISQPPLPTKLPYKNNVYWILRQQLNWYDAWKECKQKGSDLASVHSISEQVFLEDIVKRDGFPLWIGLSNHNGNDSDFEWSDGSQFEYQPWEYQHSHTFGNCFAMDTKGIWNRRKCTSQGDGAICYFSSNKVQLKQTETSSKCPDSPNEASQWLHYKDYCYAFDMAFYNYSIYTGTTARKICKKLNPSADVLTIKDEEENTFVSTHLKEYYFITGKVWLGIQFNDKSLNWLDGSEVKYTNWVNETEKANGQCSVIFSTNGTWSKADCNNEQSRVVCKIPQVSHHSRGAIAFGVIFVIALLVGLGYVLYRKMQLHSIGLASVRYERGMYDDETDTMFSRNDD